MRSHKFDEEIELQNAKIFYSEKKQVAYRSYGKKRHLSSSFILQKKSKYKKFTTHLSCFRYKNKHEEKKKSYEKTPVDSIILNFMLNLNCTKRKIINCNFFSLRCNVLLLQICLSCTSGLILCMNLFFFAYMRVHQCMLECNYAANVNLLYISLTELCLSESIFRDVYACMHWCADTRWKSKTLKFKYTSGKKVFWVHFTRVLCASGARCLLHVYEIFCAPVLEA